MQTRTKISPDCPQGYSHRYLASMLTPEQYNNLLEWMNGQTQTICDGRSYNHSDKRYEHTSCFKYPHGVVIYEWDFDRWYKGLPITDW